MHNPKTEIGKLIIVAVIDERTPDVCLAANGMTYHGDLPHDTGDPENLCRCYATITDTPTEE